MWALIDFKTPEGQMWDWDPNICCSKHALAPLDQSLSNWLTDWLNDALPDGPYPHRESESANCVLRK